MPQPLGIEDASRPLLSVQIHQLLEVIPNTTIMMFVDLAPSRSTATLPSIMEEEPQGRPRQRAALRRRRRRRRRRLGFLP